MFTRYFAIITVLILSTGCVKVTPNFNYKYVHKHDPVMDQNGGVVVLVDVCNQVDVVGKDDYCIINESKVVASALAGEIKAYLNQNGISVRTEIIPFVCGMRDNPENSPVFVAENKDSEIKEDIKPFGISEEILNDTEYQNALTSLSTYVFERGMIAYQEKTAKKKDDFQRPKLIIEEDQFKEAVDIIKVRTNASSLLYIGVKGNKISGGKKFGQGLLSFTVGMATGIATAGLGTGYYATFMPGGDSDWWYDAAGLINLETKELSWNNYIYAGNDPLETKNIAAYNNIKLLLQHLFFDRVPIS